MINSKGKSATNDNTCVHTVNHMRPHNYAPHLELYMYMYNTNLVWMACKVIKFCFSSSQNLAELYHL